MRCHYMSDLHLEAAPFRGALPRGDVLIIAGDLCHARGLDPARADPYSIAQRGRVFDFIERATRSFAHVLLVAGNHEHYDGVFEDTVPLLRRAFPGVTVLDDEAALIGGVQFFGTTLWSSFEDGSPAALDRVRRRMGEYFFVKRRVTHDDGRTELARFRPEDALEAHRRALRTLQRHLDDASGAMTVIVSHHPPSPSGLNPRHSGNGLDGAYASDLDHLIERITHVPVWVHGHTHIRRTYRIGATLLAANCRGFEGRDATASGFSAKPFFEL
ncbi:MAG TPA: metallophosphoesterase [Hyphomicrobiaceae bacterium]|nr:metallophosphoesterase [Hyphomicrobiaceae bacterium]